MSKPKIGFIGLGLMGAAMVERLQSCGYDLTVLGNRSRTRIDAAIARGASEATDAKSLAEAVDVIMLCVSTSDQVEGRLRGDTGVIAGLSAGKVVIDFGTSKPNSTITLGDEIAATGATFLDAPLGRTPASALEGKLNIMGAGDKDTFDQVRPILDQLGENVFHLGPLGAGHKMKLINNYMAMSTAVAMAEAFAMADTAGVPRETVYSILSSGPSHSMMMDFVRNYAVDGNPDMGFSIGNAGKDLSYYNAMAEDLGARTWIASATLEALSGAKEDGFGDNMVPEVVDYLKKHMTA